MDSWDYDMDFLGNHYSAYQTQIGNDLCCNVLNPLHFEYSYSLPNYSLLY